MPYEIVIEPDPEPRSSKWHKKILSTKRIPNTKAGYDAVLECGHRVQIFGDLSLTGGVALCHECGRNG